MNCDCLNQDDQQKKAKGSNLFSCSQLHLKLPASYANLPPWLPKLNLYANGFFCGLLTGSVTLHPVPQELWQSLHQFCLLKGQVWNQTLLRMILMTLIHVDLQQEVSSLWLLVVNYWWSVGGGGKRRGFGQLISCAIKISIFVFDQQVKNECLSSMSSSSGCSLFRMSLHFFNVLAVFSGRWRTFSLAT